MGARIVRSLVLSNLVLTLLYVILGKLGLLLAFVHASATPVWPPSGLALAALLLHGPRLWPGVLFGAFLVNITTAGTLGSTLGITLGNTLEALIGMYLVNRFANGVTAFARAQDVFVFALAAVCSTALGATIGATSLAGLGQAAWDEYGFIWLTWWLGDAAGQLVVAPLLILWALSPRPQWTLQQWREGAWLVLVLVGIGGILFGGLLPMQNYPLSFLTVPVLVWAGFRFGARETVTAVCLLSGFALWGTLTGRGPFLTGSPNESLLMLQAFMAVISVMSLALTGAVSENQRAHAALRQVKEDLDRRVQERTKALEAEIVERKRAEDILQEKSRLLTQAQHVAGIGSWTWDMSSDTVTWSEELYQLYGVSPPEFTPTYAGYLSLVDPEDRANVKRLVDESARSGAPLQYDHRIIHRDGTVRIMRCRGEVVRDEHGNPIQMVGVNQDITESRQLENQLYQAQKMEAIGRLAGGIAHDFNNMVMGIMGFADLLLANLEPHSAHRQHVEQIRIAGEQARLLTARLLAFSRRQVLQPKVLDLNELIRHLERLLAILIGEDIELTTDLEPSLERVKADAGQLEQVIINLAINARDAMPTGGRLVIETRNVRITPPSLVEPGSYVTLTVRDTGCGMDKQTRSHLFEPFFTTKGKGKGTGLGLSTVYGIVKQSAGQISVESEPGEGSTFTIHLPATTDPLDVDPRQALRIERGTGTETVLVVEDEEVVRVLVCQSLRAYGYTALPAKDGFEAIRVAERHDGPIHLLLTDVVMPGMSGPEVAKEILRLRAPLRVVFMSGYSENPIVQASMSQTNAVFLRKPVMPGNLARAVRQELDGCLDLPLLPRTSRGFSCT
jgi:two-component system cell cycle sensor histidine kinase/response regulator CckA